MNILEALEVALPELPRNTGKQRFPQLDPRVIAREHIEQGAPTVLAKMPGADSFIRFTTEQWKLIQLFDGERSYADISDQPQNGHRLAVLNGYVLYYIGNVFGKIGRVLQNLDNLFLLDQRD